MLPPGPAVIFSENEAEKHRPGSAAGRGQGETFEGAAAKLMKARLRN
jgi:hypothetical protein